MPASSRSEFSSYLLGDQTPTVVSRALWYQITAVGGVRIGLAKISGELKSPVCGISQILEENRILPYLSLKLTM